MNIEWKGSPNFTKGRLFQKVNVIVVHWIAGTLPAADAVFAQTKSQVSAHYGIGGQVIHQYVDEKNTAWHAGNWLVNLRSIGIEHEGGPTIAIDDETYRTSGRLIADICKRNGLVPSDQTIKPHKEFKNTQCPGNLDIARLIEAARVAYGELMAPPVQVEASTSAEEYHAPEPQPRYQFNQNLQPGDRNDEVGHLQDRLVELGLMNAADVKAGRNIYGPRTTKAVAEFQVQRGILPSTGAYGAGYFGPKTRQVMNG